MAKEKKTDVGTIFHISIEQETVTRIEASHVTATFERAWVMVKYIVLNHIWYLYLL
jgi:hypothetical protein